MMTLSPQSQTLLNQSAARRLGLTVQVGAGQFGAGSGFGAGAMDSPVKANVPEALSQFTQGRDVFDSFTQSRSKRGAEELVELQEQQYHNHEQVKKHLKRLYTFFIPMAAIAAVVTYVGYGHLNLNAKVLNEFSQFLDLRQKALSAVDRKLKTTEGEGLSQLISLYHGIKLGRPPRYILQNLTQLSQSMAHEFSALQGLQSSVKAYVQGFQSFTSSPEKVMELVTLKPIRERLLNLSEGTLRNRTRQHPEVVFSQLFEQAEMLTQSDGSSNLDRYFSILFDNFKRGIELKARIAAGVVGLGTVGTLATAQELRTKRNWL